MKARDVSNPPVRFRDPLITYDEGEGPPPVKVTLLEDHSRSILSKNDSPDLSFNWSANPYVSVISKSALVERDIDLFLALANEARFFISVSLAFSDNAQSRAIEPWAASPDRRFKVIETLAKAGVPVGIMLAPIIPGVNDSQMVTVLERAAAAGVQHAGWSLLRLPGAVKQVFEERIREVMPLAADKVLHRIRSTRGGDKLYDSRFHTRGRGEGPYADTLAMMFDTTVKRLGINVGDDEEGDQPSPFRRPPPRTGQMSLF